MAVAPGLGGRGGTLGGTGWGGLLGISRWKTPHDIWLRAKGLDHETPQNEAMKDGIRLESIVSDLAQVALGGSVVPPTVETLRWPSPFQNFTASIDRMMYLDGALQGPIELKTMSAKGSWPEGGPEEYLLQLQSYLWCTHLHQSVEGKECDWGALVGLQAPREVLRMIRTTEDAQRALEHKAATLHVEVVKRDPFFMTQTVPYALRWWRTHVVGNEPPPVDNTTSCTRALQAHYSKRGGEVEATPDIVSVAAERESVRLQISGLEKHKTELDNRLRELMGEAQTAWSDSIRVSITPVAGPFRFDQTSFKEEHPLIWQRFQRQGRSFDRISVKLKDKS